MEGEIFHAFFLIFCGAAAIASFALYTRQPLLVAYITLGILIGPHGFAIMTDIKQITEMSHIGIIFLLFLLGLDMHPGALIAVVKKATSIAIFSSIIFGMLGFGLGWLCGFTFMESMVIGMASLFSSTIIGIKLLPTTVLHHKHTGELMVGLLLLQDFLAILCILALFSSAAGTFEISELARTLLALPILVIISFVIVRFLLINLFAKFDRFHEYIFLLAIGWCLGLAVLAEWMNLSPEIGAFIAGISIATSPIAQYIALNLRPLRDFFLILFFFSLGAQLNIQLLPQIIVYALIFAALVLAVKPVVFHFLLLRHSERKELAWDIGFRLGQISEFSLLIVFVALSQGVISEKVSVLIQTAAILSFIISSYIVVFNFPNPIAVSDKLRRD